MGNEEAMQLRPVGHVESPLTDTAAAPKQGDEGAPEAWIALQPAYAEAAADLGAGEDLIVLTWLDRAGRDVLAVHPRGDASRPRQGARRNAGAGPEAGPRCRGRTLGRGRQFP
jgi:tRNA (Thr-GGU) A37 N-methylase